MVFRECPNYELFAVAHVQSLKSIEQFSKLENLTNFDGDVDSLEPLRHLKSLTHININSKVQSLEPLAVWSNCVVSVSVFVATI